MNHGKKMSNSDDNAIRIREITERYNPNIVRLYIFSEHYRQTMHFSESKLRKLEKLDKKISKIVSASRIAGPLSSNDKNEYAPRKQFLSYIENDFDTANALRVLTDLIESGYASAIFLEILQNLGL